MLKPFFCCVIPLGVFAGWDREVERRVQEENISLCPDVHVSQSLTGVMFTTRMTQKIIKLSYFLLRHHRGGLAGARGD